MNAPIIVMANYAPEDWQLALGYPSSVEAGETVIVNWMPDDGEWFIEPLDED